jgi:glucose-1-phosphate adenylyltransferase
VILSSDHVYKMNYMQMVAYHVLKKADLTISAVRVTKERAAGRLGTLEIDRNSRLIGFEEKSAHPRTHADAAETVLASMGVYIFRADALVRAVQGGGHDFGKDIIPEMMGNQEDIFVYDYEKENSIEDSDFVVREGIRERRLIEKTPDSSYWKDVGSIDTYYETNLELVAVDPPFSLYGEKWPLRTFQRPMPPSKCILGGRASESIVCDGCIISGATVSNSILSPGVIVERNALVEQSVLFDDVIIEPGVRLRRAIIDKRTTIRAGSSIGYDQEEDRRRGYTISDKGIVVVPETA